MTQATEKTTDRYNRPIRDLRISVTDRCNFRCVYCMPREIFGNNYQFLRRDELLHFEEIERVAQVFAGMGVEKIRLTGGEPLVRADLETLIGKLAAIDGIADIGLTTNGSLLTVAKAQSLRASGLKRITVSLDSVDEDTFRSINDVNIGVDQVLRGIENARIAGFESVKVNMVVKKGLNDHSVVRMARKFHGSDVILRFIEFMDVGNSNGWEKSHVVTAQEMIDQIHAVLPIEPVDPNYQGEVAKRWRYLDGGGELGFITSVSQPFCGQCSRIRLSAVGRLYTCLFATDGYDLRSLIRSEATDETLRDRIRSLWQKRRDRYSEVRVHTPPALREQKIEMSYIGG